MTTINIPGKITAIEVDEVPFYSSILITLTPVNGGIQYNWNTPLIINPTGSPVTTILYDDSAFHDLGGLGPNYAQLAPSFNVNDIVELYKNPAIVISGSGLSLTNENGNGMPNFRSRKIQVGTNNYWIPI